MISHKAQNKAKGTYSAGKVSAPRDEVVKAIEKRKKANLPI